MFKHQNYCMRCHAGKTIVNSSPVVFKNGSLAVKGTCSSCDATTYKIINKQDMERQIKTQQMNLLKQKKYSDNLKLAALLSCLAAGVMVGLFMARML